MSIALPARHTHQAATRTAVTDGAPWWSNRPDWNTRHIPWTPPPGAQDTYPLTVGPGHDQYPLHAGSGVPAPYPGSAYPLTVGPGSYPESVHPLIPTPHGGARPPTIGPVPAVPAVPRAPTIMPQHAKQLLDDAARLRDRIQGDEAQAADAPDAPVEAPPRSLEDTLFGE